MHLSEIVLANSDPGKIVLGAGIALAAAGTAIGLRKLDYERMPRVAVLSSAFFVATLIQIPLTPPAHLVLNGLAGVILGWAAFPALLIALLLQAVLLPVTAGPLAVGINTVVMALPAVVCHYLFRAAVRGRRDGVALAGALAAGVTGVLLAAILCAVALYLTGETWRVLAQATLVANLPVAVVDGLVTGSIVMFLRKVRPEIFDTPLLASPVAEMPRA